MTSLTRPADVLADVISVMQMANTILCQQEVAPPWGMAFSPGPRVNIHYVARGSCWLQPADASEPTHLLQGDLVFLSRGTGHTLADSPGSPIASVQDVLRRPLKDEKQERTRLLCGAYLFEENERNPLLSLLPAVVVIRADETDTDPSIAAVLQLLVRESRDPEVGAATVMSRLLDALFVYVLRSWLTAQPPTATGWLGGLRDPAIAAALSSMHHSPAHPWTVATLARVAGLSRTAFAQRFASIIGEPPATYLRNWRMTLAAARLRDTDDRTYAIANDVGYESETAFSAAFRRARGVSPSSYRKQHKTSGRRSTPGDAQR